MSPKKIIALLGALFLISAEASAQESVIKHQYESCKSHIKRQARTSEYHKYMYVVWVPGIIHTCTASDFPPAQAKKTQLQAYEKAARKVSLGAGSKTSFSFTGQYRLAVDQGRIVDKTYARAIGSLQPLSVNLKIFDDKTKNLQSTRAQLVQLPTRFRGLDMVAWSFTIQAKGVPLCDGSAKMGIGASISFAANCFGETFRGKARINTVTQRNGMYYLVPDVVRIASKGSWMEMRF